MKRVVWFVFLGVLLNACGVYRVEDASIDRVNLELMPETSTVRVVAHGVLGNGCTRVGEIEQRREGSTFFVTIKAIYDQPTRTGCTLAISEFQEEIVLDVAGLENGSYAVNVNGVIETFTLPLEALYEVHVDEVEVALLETSPVQIVVSADGSLRSGCEKIAEVSQRFEGITFFVTILGSFPSGAVCTPDAPPFSEAVTLETTDLAPGTYEVNVNGTLATFPLP